MTDLVDPSSVIGGALYLNDDTRMDDLGLRRKLTRNEVIGYLACVLLLFVAAVFSSASHPILYWPARIVVGGFLGLAGISLLFRTLSSPRVFAPMLAGLLVLYLPTWIWIPGEKLSAKAGVFIAGVTLMLWGLRNGIVARAKPAGPTFRAYLLALGWAILTMSVPVLLALIQY